MAKIDVTLCGVVGYVKDISTKLSRVMVYVTSAVQHNNGDTEKLYSVPKQVPIDMKDSEATSVSAGKGIKIRVTGEPSNLKSEIVSVFNCPGCMLENFAE